jgi:hypothetical protein
MDELYLDGGVNEALCCSGRPVDKVSVPKRSDRVQDNRRLSRSFNQSLWFFYRPYSALPSHNCFFFTVDLMPLDATEQCSYITVIFPPLFRMPDLDAVVKWA